MTRYMRLISRWLVTMVAISSIVGTGMSLRADDTGPVIIASDYWCPYACEPGGEYPGYLIELTSHILDQAGLDNLYIATGFERAARNVADGKWDILIATNSDFTPRLLLTDTSVVRTSESFFTLRGSGISVGSPADLDGLVIGLIAGYDYGPAMNKWMSVNKDQVILVRSVSPYERLLDMLEMNRIDIILEEHNAVSWWARNRAQPDMIEVVGKGGQQMLYNGFSPDTDQGRRLKVLFDQQIPLLKETAWHDRLLTKYGLGGELVEAAASD